MDPGTVVTKLSNGIQRGSSPTFGCDQCHDWDSFKYTIYDPPTVSSTEGKVDTPLRVLRVLHV